MLTIPGVKSTFEEVGQRHERRGQKNEEFTNEDHLVEKRRVNSQKKVKLPQKRHQQHEHQKAENGNQGESMPVESIRVEVALRVVRAANDGEGLLEIPQAARQSVHY